MPQGIIDRAKLFLREPKFTDIRVAVLAKIAYHQCQAMEDLLGEGDKSGGMAKIELENSQRYQHFIDVLDELASPDFRFTSAEIKNQ